MSQTAAIKPLVDAAARNRLGVLFMSCAPDAPAPWRLQVVALSQKACEKVKRIIREELETGEQNYWREPSECGQMNRPIIESLELCPR